MKPVILIVFVLLLFSCASKLRLSSREYVGKNKYLILYSDSTFIYRNDLSLWTDTLFSGTYTEIDSTIFLKNIIDRRKIKHNTLSKFCKEKKDTIVILYTDDQFDHYGIFPTFQLKYDTVTFGWNPMARVGIYRVKRSDENYFEIIDSSFIPPYQEKIYFQPDADTVLFSPIFYSPRPYPLFERYLLTDSVVIRKSSNNRITIFDNTLSFYRYVKRATKEDQYTGNRLKYLNAHNPSPIP